jgi:hypothetical protein
MRSNATRLALLILALSSLPSCQVVEVQDKRGNITRTKSIDPYALTAAGKAAIIYADYRQNGNRKRNINPSK